MSNGSTVPWNNTPSTANTVLTSWRFISAQLYNTGPTGVNLFQVNYANGSQATYFLPYGPQGQVLADGMLRNSVDPWNQIFLPQVVMGGYTSLPWLWFGS